MAVAVSRRSLINFSRLPLVKSEGFPTPRGITSERSSEVRRFHRTSSLRENCFVSDISSVEMLVCNLAADVATVEAVVPFAFYIARQTCRQSFGISPDSGSFAFAEELDVDDVWIAADGAVFDVLLVIATRFIERDDDLLAAGGQV